MRRRNLPKVISSAGRAKRARSVSSSRCINARICGASARAWAACIKRVFEMNPVLCVKCGGMMKLVAVIGDDKELDWILVNQGWPADFPRTKPARPPPDRAAEEDACQADPRSEQWDGQDRPDNDWPA